MTDKNSDNDRTESFVALTKDTSIGHYTIIEKIGAGGMGEVYLAEDTKLKRKVALKFLPPNMCQDEDCRNRFKREAQATAKLNHPNIGAVYEVGEKDGKHFIALQYIEGQTLQTFPRDDRQVLVRIIRKVAFAVHAAHEKGIIHRDIKPANIMVEGKVNSRKKTTTRWKSRC